MGRKPREHGSKRIRSETVRREDEASRAGALFEQAARKTLARTCIGNRHRLRGGKVCLERRAATFRERAVIILRIELTIGDHHLVGMDAPTGGNDAGASVASSMNLPARK
jgi:hypothetical protein